MAPVQQRVLNWLYSVLTNEYENVDRTYTDTALALVNYSSLSPKTDVYTYENGASALLLQVSGTLPVPFRGTTYRYPITIWMPQQYPRVEPIIYVTPTDGMAVRAGQHVDPQGRIYHPYLASWGQHSDKSNLRDFLAILREVFGKEPPVVARQPQAPPVMASPQPQSIPPPLPPLPPGVGRQGGAQPPAGSPQPPPPPPKPQSTPQTPVSPPSRYSTAPPLPPSPAARPPQPGSAASYSGPPPLQYTGAQSAHTPQQRSNLRYESAPPLPPQANQPAPPPNYQGQPPLPYTQPGVQTNQYGPPQPPLQQQYTGQGGPPMYQPQYGQPPQAQWQQGPRPSQQWQPQPQAQPPQPKPKAPIPDLLDDAPILSPQPASNLPKPPVPPNPEKDDLLHEVGRQLYTIRQSESRRNASTLAGLYSQRDALNAALANLHHESTQLTSLHTLLSTNTAALNQSLASADKLIAVAPQMTPPNIDELLVAPTVVANQLYELVAEERALGDAIFCLGRAVERGKVESGVFVKTTRALAREWFLKKWMVRKCGRGMGLDGV